MEQLYPLTYSQKNILTIDKLYPNKSINSIAGTLKIKNTSDIEHLKKAINIFIKNNDGLRVRIVENNNEYYQVIDEFQEQDFEVLYFNNENELYNFEKSETEKPFSILNNVLYYFKIIAIENDIGFYVKCNHIISDAWTFSLIGSEIMKNYELLTNNENIENKGVFFVEHIEDENSYLNSERCKKDKEYWNELLKDINIKTLLKQIEKKSTKAKRKSIVLPEKLNKKIYEYCKENKTSPYNLFIAALSMYIKRATGRKDIIIGTTTLNRTNKKEKSMIGMFINTCPIRVQVNENMSFNKLLKDLNSNALALLKHQKYPYELLLKDLKEKYDFKDTIFDIVLNYQNAKFIKADENLDYTSRWHFNGNQIESLIININDREESGQLIINYDYLSCIFTEKEIDYLHKHLIGLLWHALDNDQKLISKIEMLPEEEKNRIINKFNSINEVEVFENIKIENKNERNVKAYILDENHIALPIGITGNLYIDKANNENAIDNPYVPGEKIYKTGKFARWYAQGDIEILSDTDERLLVPKFNMKSKKKVINMVLTGSFTLTPLKEYIEHFAKIFDYKINTDFSDYNQVLQDLINNDSNLLNNRDGINTILIRLTDYIRDNNGSEDEKINVIKETTELLKNLLSKVEIPTIIGLFDESKDNDNISNVISNCNKELIETIKSNKNLFIINTKELKVNYSIENEYDEMNDKTAHIPYTKEYYASLSAEIVRIVIALRRNPFKVIVLDCDNTLWKGVCGEVGAQGVEINDNFKQLQKFMLKKEQEGMLLAVCSKNVEKDVFDVFEHNSNMLIKKENIANWKVNWDNKSDNIKQMAKELNLGLDSFIFIDDNPMECMNMLENAPEVLTLQLPQDAYIPMFLKHIWATDNLVVTAEDRERSKRYIEEIKRKNAEKEIGSIDEFVKKLDMKVSFREVSEEEITRASQMTLRTNQFNLSTIRRDESEIRSLINNPAYKVFVAEAKDKFGDYGIIGLIILKTEGSIIYIDTLLLSCRILGRNVENTILNAIKTFANQINASKIIAKYVKTEKNLPILNFLNKELKVLKNESEDTIVFGININEIPEVQHVELLYNKKFDKSVSKTEKVEIHHEEIKVIDNNKDIELVDSRILEFAKDKKYLTILKEYSGKNILKSIEERIINDEYVKPETSTQEKLVKIWCDALKIKDIGITSDFFNIGGDSLSAVFVLSQISKEFKVTLDLTELFTNRTIKDIANLIESKTEDIYEEISKVKEKEYYELSSAQTRMYLIDQIEDKTTKYNECQMLNVKGKLDIEKLENAFNKVIERHEILRTAFFMKDGIPVQKIYKELKIKIDYIEVNETEVEQLTKDFIKSFDLANPPLFRVQLIKIASEEYVMLFDIHHIVIDGTSFGILIKEVLSIYDDIALEELKVQYKDFAVWQNKQFETEKMKKQEEFWLKQFADEIPVLNMPTDYPRPAVQSVNGKKLYFTIDKDTTSKIKEICKETETTLFMFLFAVYNVLLHRYTGQEDIVVGIPVAGRNHPDIKNMLGMFINNLAIRTYPKGDMTFKDYLMQVKETMLNCLNNQEYPYEKLINKLGIARDMSRNPLFDVMFSLQNMYMPEIKTKDVVFEQCEYDNGTTKHDFRLFATEQYNSLHMELEYCIDLFSEQFMLDFLKHFINLINKFNDVSLKIGKVEILNSLEKDEILSSFNLTNRKYRNQSTIVELFEEQVEKKPNNIAIIFDGKEMTYNELNNRANKLAKILRENGAKSDFPIGIMLDRSFEMVISILAIIKAGGYYIPIDTSYPIERIQYILENSNSSILILNRKYKNTITFSNMMLEIESFEFEDGNQYDNLNIINESKDLIYAIYTSGSTGKPKGVMIEHRNVVNLIEGINEKIDFDNMNRMLLLASVCFDMFTFEMWFPLCTGRTVVLANREHQIDIVQLKELIIKTNVDIVQMTPSRMKLIMESIGQEEVFDKIKLMLLGGEAFPEAIFEMLKTKTSAKIYNMYGPTETTVWSSLEDLTNKNKIYIGRPISNTKFYVLSRDMMLQPFGVNGELCISGEGVARGYLNRDDLTKEKFILNPFNDKERMYKTGDIVKINREYNIEFVGRVDEQIKIRGYRVELDEVEGAILTYNGIENVVVLVDKETTTLRAYYISKTLIDTNDLREYLLNKIPSYMIPTFLLQIKEFPLNSNGKIDRLALVKLKSNEIKKKKNQKLTDTEKDILSVWKEVLKNDTIEVEDNFFIVGGDSLSIIAIISRLFNMGINLKAQYFYDYPTVRELAHQVDNINTNYKNDLYNDMPKINQTLQDIGQTINFNNVFLTGATGYLGIHILKELIDNTTSTVYCLIRGNNIEQRLTELLNYYFDEPIDKLIGTRIICVNGDTSKNNFGIEENEYNELGQKLDLVIHTAAIVKHQGNYDDFYNVNVLGTKRIIDFATMFNLKLGYMSTESVSGDYMVKQSNPLIDFTEQDFYIGQNFTENVYVRSKVESEKLILEAINNGLDVAIFRLGMIAARSSDGKFQINRNDNNFYNILRSMVNIKVFPTKILEQDIEFTPVDECAHGIIKVLQHTGSYKRVLHFYNQNYIKVKELYDIFTDILNLTIELIDVKNFAEYINVLKNKGVNENALAIVINNFNYEKILLDDNYRVKMNNTITQDYLRKIDFSWSKIDKDYFVTSKETLEDTEF